MTPAERDTRILSLEPLVKGIARRRGSTLPRCIRLEDLISAGWLGAIAAVDRFDPKKKVLLSTFADRKISGAIGDYLRVIDPVTREHRKLLKASPAMEPPRTFSLNRTHDDTRGRSSFDIGDKRSLAAFRVIETRLALAAICRAATNVKPRSLRIVERHASGERMKAIARSYGINESRVSQICKATLVKLRAAA